MQKKLRMSMYVLSVGLILGLAAGCGGGGEPDCTAVTNPCTELSALQCSSDSATIEVCLENEDGCFQWSLQTECAAGEQCDDSAGEPACGCTDACATDGATRCSSTAIQECQMGTSGCLGWVEIQDCADTSLICDASGGSAECVEGCTDACTAEGLTSCHGSIIQTCTMGTNLCLAWVDGIDCAATSEACDDDSGTAQCVGGCVDTCTTAGATQCNGTVIETCATDTDGCLAWTPGTDCNTTGEVCNDTSGTAQCEAACVDECTRQPEPESQLISVLHKVQAQFGYLAEAHLDAVAQLMQVPAAKVSGVAGFYHYFRLQPRGRFLINVCLGTACYVKGADRVAQKLRDELGITFGETSTDGMFTLEASRCLGTCGLAPVIMVDQDVHPQVTPDKVPAILEKYLEKARKESGASTSSPAPGAP